MLGFGHQLFRANCIFVLLLLVACSNNNSNNDGTSNTSSFDHSLVAGEACITCHNGSNATGKADSHILTTDACEFCHGTSQWAPLYMFDHAHALGNCVTCHNNVVEDGKSDLHLPTTDVCEACHSYWRSPQWRSEGNQVDHDEVLGLCSFCHDGMIAVGKPLGHVFTTDECNVCHIPGAPFTVTVVQP